MKISMIEAIDFFGKGGYIDLELGTYSQSCGSPLSSEILVAPVIRSTYVSYNAAKQLGVSHDRLLLLGFNAVNHQDPFYSIDDTFKLRKNGYSDLEWEAVESISDYMGEIGQFRTFVEKELELRHELILSWLSNHGIEVT